MNFHGNNNNNLFLKYIADQFLKKKKHLLKRTFQISYHTPVSNHVLTIPSNLLPPVSLGKMSDCAGTKIDFQMFCNIRIFFRWALLMKINYFLVQLICVMSEKTDYKLITSCCKTTDMPTYTDLYIYIYTYMRIYVYIAICLHIQTYTYIYICWHILQTYTDIQT